MNRLVIATVFLFSVCSSFAQIIIQTSAATKPNSGVHVKIEAGHVIKTQSFFQKRSIENGWFSAQSNSAEFASDFAAAIAKFQCMGPAKLDFGTARIYLEVAEGVVTDGELFKAILTYGQKAVQSNLVTDFILIGTNAEEISTELHLQNMLGGSEGDTEAPDSRAGAETERTGERSEAKGEKGEKSRPRVERSVTIEFK